MDSKTKKLIKYVDTLEKANNMISELECPKELNTYQKEIKDITGQLSSIIDLVDTEHHEIFYGGKDKKIKELENDIKKLQNQIDMMWKGFEEGISVDEMNQRIFPEAFEDK